MSFRRRTFPEVLESLLTSITKGVAAESHPFPPPGAAGPPFDHNLQQPPVREIVSIYGSLNGEPHLFRKGADYELQSDNQTLRWKAQGADLPDDGSLILINYYPQSAQPVLTDLFTGSIVRTLAETVGLEIARLNAQLEAVYNSAFIDTATGKALDNVVALLGIDRIQGGRAAGEVEFTRTQGSSGIINIPAGTRITTGDGNVEYETTESVTLAAAQGTIRVTARDLEANDPLAADALTILPVPIFGISAVTNPKPTAITTQDETDAELRARAKSFLHGSERATLGAIKGAISRQGISADVEEVANTPGRIEITPHAESLPPELQQRLLRAIEDARPAGVLVTLKGVQPPRKADLKLRITTAPELLEQDLRAVQKNLRAKIEDYFSRLSAKEPPSTNRLIGLALSIPQIQDVQILNATWTVDGTTVSILDLNAGQLKTEGFTIVLGDLQIADPNLPTKLNVVVTFPAGQNPADKPAIEAALSAALIYINNLNATELATPADAAEIEKRKLSYEKLLRVIPMPKKPGESLEAFDNAEVPPALPNEGTIAPYEAKFIFTQQNNLSKILSKATDASYALTPFERVSLAGVEVKAEGGDA